MTSYLPILAASLAYVWAAYLALQDPVVRLILVTVVVDAATLPLPLPPPHQTTPNQALSGFSGSIDLGTLTKGFSSETAVACAWAHFIAQVCRRRHRRLLH